MIDLDNGLGAGFLAECGEQVIALEKELLALEVSGQPVDHSRASRAFRLLHSIRGGAYFLDLEKIGDIAHRAEDMLALISAGQMTPTPARIDVLLRASDRIHDLIRNPVASNEADIEDIMAALTELPGLAGNCAGRVSLAAQTLALPYRRLRVLVVEDDFTSRLLLQTFLSRYGDCHIAVNGLEAIDACRMAAEKGENYDLICMDIMMPEMDGQEAVRKVRALEDAQGIRFNRGARITMTTTVRDVRKVFQCFRELCDAYLVKPIDLNKLSAHMKGWGMVP